MNQGRPYMRESVKSLEKVFSDYAFNKKVLTAVRAELKLRTTKSAAALLLKVQQRLEEIEKRDRFGAKAVRKVTPSATPSPSQLPLIDKTTAKPTRAERPITPPPSPPRPQPATVSSPPKSTAPPPSKRDTQAKVKAEADRAVSVSLVGLIVLFAVIALLFSWGKKLNSPATAQRQSHAPINWPSLPSRAEAPPGAATAEGVQEEYESFMLEHKKKVMEWAKRQSISPQEEPPQQGTRQPEALNKAQPQSFDERLKDYRNTVDALLN